MRLLLVLLLLLGDDHPLTAEQRKTIDDQNRAVLGRADDAGLLGDAHFKLGKFSEAVSFYNQMVAQDPALEKSHWRRGIAFFYAGEYEKAAKQFEDYHSFDNVDRENGIWRYLSQRKAFGKEKAAEWLLKYEKDDREPFPDVYQLFEGKRTPEQIIAKIKAAEIGDGDREMRYFYAHLYCGLSLAVEGKPAEAKAQLRKAVENKWAPGSGFGPDYMWHVGRVHYDLLASAK